MRWNFGGIDMKVQKMKSYLIVFIADEEVKGDIVDVGKDPDFSKPAPTWGICRPNYRKSVQVGYCLFFIGYFRKKKKYYFKGYFEVGEKISYIEALKRFPDRKNVIISRNKSNKRIEDLKWRYPNRKKCFRESGSGKYPHFLKSVKLGGETYYQNPDDDHEIDNWKCSRIYHCREKDFFKCVFENKCMKESDSTFQGKLNNYIVANKLNYVNVGKEEIEFDENQISKKIRTPKGQHNVLLLSDSERNIIQKTLSRYK